MKRIVTVLLAGITMVLGCCGPVFSLQDSQPQVVPDTPHVDLKQLSGSAPEVKTASPLEVLSDTQGVDFGPYLSLVLSNVKKKWYKLIPSSAQWPVVKKGKVSVEFQILPDGHIQGLRYTTQSGDLSLDRAAYGGIATSNPFPPLPSNFTGKFLALRFNFFYNPDPSDLKAAAPNKKTVVPPNTQTAPEILFSPAPEYTKRARQAKEEGTVLLALVVNKKGKTKNISVVSGLSEDLNKKAIGAVKKWEFRPAMKDGKPVDEPIRVEVRFKLD
jgi:TonB family protein